MNYEEMSDKGINREVASYFYDENWLSRHADMLGMIPDYCNSPSDAWPIIVENKISLIHTDNTWFAGIPNLDEGCWYFAPDDDGECVQFESYDKNPLRAAMIVFLMMQEQAK